MVERHKQRVREMERGKCDRDRHRQRDRDEGERDDRPVSEVQREGRKRQRAIQRDRYGSYK